MQEVQMKVHKAVEQLFFSFTQACIDRDKGFNNFFTELNQLFG